MELPAMAMQSSVTLPRLVKAEFLEAMEMRSAAAVVALLLAAAAATTATAAADLSYGYYDQSCPELEAVVRGALLPVFVSSAGSPASLLRLFFHDCQVMGCDASILLDSDEANGVTSEMDAGQSFGVRGRTTIDAVKSAVEAACPAAELSCADTLVLAAREAVAFSGGPTIAVPLGRRDATTASRDIAEESLPAADIGIDGMLQMFSSTAGMSVEESVAILGAHTIGVGHCVNIAPRLYGRPEEAENSNMYFLAQLRLQCPPLPPAALAAVPLDRTAAAFDNQYYNDVVRGCGLFGVDAALAADSRTAGYAGRFAEDEEHFFRVFGDAFVRLSTARVITGDGGEIRRQCNRVN